MGTFNLDKTGVTIPHRVQVAQIKHKAALKAGGAIGADGSDNPFVTINPRQAAEVTQARMAAQDEWLKYNVLVIGETGTGKELMARIVGQRTVVDSNGVIVPAPFRAVNAGAVTDTLFESIMFGHRKGSYTGADRDHIGVLEATGDGTVFIDEVGDLPLQQQVKLLRAIEQRTILPVGEVIERRINCRFVFATNKNLPAMVKRGIFRADLYYRIAEIVVHTYPLRDRSEDVVPITQRILGQNNWTPLAQDETIPNRSYSKGNVRDLRRCLLWREQGLDWEDILTKLQLEDAMADEQI